MFQATIDLKRLSHNLSVFRRHLLSGVQIMAVVKANAYGHGDVAIMQHLLKEGVKYFGVARLEEGLHLRTHSKKAKLLILSPIHPRQYQTAIENKLILTLTDPKDVTSLLKIVKKPVTIHLKVDTGLHRTGCLPSEIVSLIQKLNTSPLIKIEGLFTHFADSSHNPDFTQKQLSVFNQVITDLKQKKLLPPLIHAANTSATIKLPSSHFNLVRVGAGLYGLNPFHPHKMPINLKPILAVTSHLSRLFWLEKDEPIGYGCIFTAPKRLLVGTITGGYADFIRRAPNPWPYVEIQGQIAPVIGRISMDQITVDVTKIKPSPHLHQKVCLLQAEYQTICSAQTIATKIGTSDYELVSSLHERVPRAYTK